MGAIHLCTAESMLIDAHRLRGWCAVCCRDDRPLRIGWVDTKCEDCGAIFQADGCHDIVRQRRERLGLTRPEIASVIGVSRKTVATYETGWPSRRYWQKTEELVRST